MTERGNQQNEPRKELRTLRERASRPDGLSLELAEGDLITISVSHGRVSLFLEAAPGDSEPEREASEPISTDEEPTSDLNDGQPERQTRTRIRLSGRLASEPSYAPLPRRGLRVSFVVAEPHGDNGPTYHRAYSTGEYARRIQAKNPHKGDRVTIDGERHTNRIRQADGGYKESLLLYCYGVRTRQGGHQGG
jgi:hypothetical protein